jgi:tetratricopeptide (TPR) repeat protein
MRHFYSKLLASFLLASFTLAAQTNPDYRLHHAFLLVQGGDFAAAIDETKAVIYSGELQGAELGRAWAMLGFAYKEESQFVEAQHALDQSIHVLEHNRDDLNDYAVALSYEGALNEEEGRFDVAERARLKALEIFKNSGNRAAVAEVYRDLAELKLEEKNVRQARKFFEGALDAGAADDLTPAGRAAYALTEGTLDLAEKRFPEAVNAYERSLDLCKAAYGEKNYLTGWGFMLLGKALAQAGQLDQALADMRTGLALLGRAIGPRNLKYWVAELAYSQVLDRAGSHSEAAELKSAAERTIKDMYGQQCVNCTVNVSALR